MSDQGLPREPMLVIVESPGVSNPSSTEIVVDGKQNHNAPINKYYNYVLPEYLDGPSTSRRQSHLLSDSNSVISTNELQMIDINLQSENEIDLEATDVEKESIVLSYLRNRSVIDNVEGASINGGKKPSILNSVPKMETIVEGEGENPVVRKKTSSIRKPSKD